MTVIIAVIINFIGIILEQLCRRDIAGNLINFNFLGAY